MQTMSNFHPHHQLHHHPLSSSLAPGHFGPSSQGRLSQCPSTAMDSHAALSARLSALSQWSAAMYGHELSLLAGGHHHHLAAPPTSAFQSVSPTTAAQTTAPKTRAVATTSFSIEALLGLNHNLNHGSQQALEQLTVNVGSSPSLSNLSTSHHQQQLRFYGHAKSVSEHLALRLTQVSPDSSTAKDLGADTNKRPDTKAGIVQQSSTSLGHTQPRQLSQSPTSGVSNYGQFTCGSRKRTLSSSDDSERDSPTPAKKITATHLDDLVAGAQNSSNAATATNGSSSSSNGKSKRIRTIFTPEQLERLEAEFERMQYMVGPQRQDLARGLCLSEAQVKVWFQNRRIKWRKQNEELTKLRLARMSRGDDPDVATSSPTDMLLSQGLSPRPLGSDSSSPVHFE